MPYLIKKTIDNSIEGALQEFQTPLPFNPITHHATYVEKLHLPMFWYIDITRPQYVKLHEDQTFDVIPGVYGNVEVYKTEAIPVNKILQIKVTKVISAYKKVTISGDTTGLTYESLDKIKVVEHPESVIEDNEVFEVNANGLLHSCSLIKGVGYITLPANSQIPIYVMIRGQLYMVSCMNSNLGPYASYLSLKQERDMKLSKCDWLVLRHMTQQAGNMSTTLTDIQYSNLLVYMQTLRDLPASTLDYMNPSWPTPPDFV